MKRFAAATALACALMSSALAGEIVVPVEGKPLTVYEGETVRITATGIAGGKIDIDVTGDSKGKVTENTVVQRAGDRNSIGGMTKEVEFTPKKGKITVKVTVKNPTEQTPKVTEYEIDVKEQKKDK